MPDYPAPPLSARGRRAVERTSGGADVEDTHAARFRLGRTEPVDEGVRRVARGRIEHALEQLRGGGADGSDVVHEVRKDLKKTRAVLRLVRDRLDDETYHRENERFRDAGRLLSGPRDADVKLETLGALEDRFEGDIPPAATEAVRSALLRERAAVAANGSGPPAVRRKAIATLEEGLAAVEKWPLQGSGWKLVAPGLERTYGRSRSRFRETVADPSPAAVHEWRKRVKDLWYHLRLVRNSWRPVVAGMADEAHELADLLGDHHDLQILDEDVRARGELEGGDRMAPLLEAIERRQDELLEQAVPIGERMYAETPKAFRRRMRSYWRAWRPD